MDLTQCRSAIVFGGSFDPPHNAHIQLPQAARTKAGADAVAYLPAAQSPLKARRPATSPDHRLAMLRLALAARDDAIVLTDEIERGGDGPSYTVDTLERLRSRYGSGLTMRLLIGGDQLRIFDQWRCWQRIVELAEPLVMVRPPQTRDQLLGQIPAAFDRPSWAARIVELPAMNVSSTDIRRRVAQGEPIDTLVPPAVAAYIAEHRLYRS